MELLQEKSRLEVLEIMELFQEKSRLKVLEIMELLQEKSLEQLVLAIANVMPGHILLPAPNGIYSKLFPL